MDGARVRRFRERQKAAGRRVIRESLGDILDRGTYAAVRRADSTGCYADGLERCRMVAGFGSLLGESVVRTLGGSPEEARGSIEWSALWNLLVAFFDEVCDEYGSLRPLLLNRISDASLRIALQRDSDLRLTPESSDSVLLRFVVEVADAVFRRFRELGPRVSDPAFNRVAHAIRKAYASEIKTSQLRFHASSRAEDMRGHLRASSALPVWILGHGSALAAGLSPLPKGVDSSLEHIGDTLWLLDDLVDLEKDVGTDRWNAIFLAAADLHGSSVLQRLGTLAPEERISWLYEHEMPAVLADRILERIRAAIRELEGAFGGGTALTADLVDTVRSFAHNHVEELMPDPD